MEAIFSNYQIYVCYRSHFIRKMYLYAPTRFVNRDKTKTNVFFFRKYITKGGCLKNLNDSFLM